MIKLRKPSVKEAGLLAGALVLMLAGVWLLVLAIHPGTKPPVKPKQAPIAVVEISPDGFTPATLKVTPGTKVVWVNKDQAPHRIAADPYPTHTELPALFAPKAMGFNQTYSFVFTKVRTIQYHDELNPTLEGSIEISKS